MKLLFRWFLLLAIAGVAALLPLSVGYRLYRGKPIFRPDFPDASVLETWRPASSRRSAFVPRSVVPRIHWIAVAQDQLWVSPHFPLNLWFLPEALHLDFRIPGRTILDVTELSSSPNEPLVRVRFRHATGEEDSVEVMVRDSDAFRKALAVIRS